MNLSIAQRITLLSILLVTVTAGVVAVVFYQNSSKILVDQHLQNLSGQVGQESLRLTTKIEALRNNVRFLARTPPIQGIIRARQGGGQDIEGASTEEQWRLRLEHIFLTQLQTNADYMQARFMDAKGNELIRVERKNGRIYPVPNSGLQNKAGRNYVEETLALPEGQVFLSDINLNREHGQIASPHIPVLRLGTPVYGSEGKLFGLLIINLDFSQELKRIQRSYSQQVQSLFVTDYKGSYLSHPNPGKLYGVSLGTPFRIQKDFHQLSLFFKPGNQTRGITLLPKQTQSQMAVIFTKILLDQANPDRFIIVGLGHSYEDIADIQQSALTSSAYWALLLILIGTVLAYTFSIMLIKPLKQVTQGIEDFSYDQRDISLPVNREDEIGVLARSFTDLITQVKTSQYELTHLNTSLEKLVKDRTQALEKAEIRQRTILNTMVDPLITIDDQGIIESFNPAAEKMFGYGADEVIDQNVNILMPEPYHSEHDGYLEHYKATGEKRILGIGRDVAARRKDGEVIPVELAVSEMWFGDKRMFTSTLRDISERKRIDRMKNEFISTVSHELRTPLTSIRGSLGLVIGGAMGELPEKIRPLMEIANNNTERLLLLINDLLDIEKIESGRLVFKFKNIEVMPLIEQAITANASYGEQHNISFEITERLENTHLFADPDRLMQVMANLLSNATKFSPEGDGVGIAVTRHDANIRISVTDNGPGIPADFQPKLFEKFTQSDASDTRNTGGTGLGLNITRAIIEKHNGHIDFSTAENAGTTFYFELPEITTEAGEEKKHLPTQPEGESRPCILIIEDDPDIAALLGHILAEAGFASDIAYNATQASQYLTENPERYTAATLDLILPDQNGIDLFKKLRSQETTKELPIIVVSAKADSAKDELNGGAVGIADWLQKPIDEKYLQETIRRFTASGPPRILHVEDDPDVQQVVNILLRDQAKIVSTSTLREAKQLLQQNHFDLVLLDIGLPDGSGLDLLETIEHRANPPQVVVFSSDNVDEEVAQQVNAVMVKSSTSNTELVNSIKSFLPATASEPVD